MYSLKRNLGMVTIFTILALSIGTASALDTTGSFVHGNGTFPMGAGYHGHAGNVTWQTQMLQSSVTKLGQQGVDVSQPQADIAGGNISAAMQWLDSYHKTHTNNETWRNTTGHQTGNVTRQTQMLQSSVTKLGQQGADVAELQSDITNGNITAAMQWLKSYFQAHPDQMKYCSCTQKNAGLTFHNQTLQGRGSAGHSWV